MKRLIIILLVVAVIAPLAIYDAMAIDKPPPDSTTRAINNQAATDCNLCFTCGGDWPVTAGYFRSYGDRPYERGSSCSGSLAVRVDSSPRLCCKD